MSEMSEEAKKRHWSKTFNLSIGVLVVWFIFSFIVPWFAKELNSFSFLGFPLGYYMIVQGSLIVFVVTIFVQNWLQDKIDDEAGAGGE